MGRLTIDHEAEQKLCKEQTVSYCKAFYHFLTGFFLVIGVYFLGVSLCSLIVRCGPQTFVIFRSMQLQREGSRWVPTKKLTLAMKLDSRGLPNRVAGHFRDYKAKAPPSL